MDYNGENLIPMTVKTKLDAKSLVLAQKLFLEKILSNKSIDGKLIKSLGKQRQKLVVTPNINNPAFRYHQNSQPSEAYQKNDDFPGVQSSRDEREIRTNKFKQQNNNIELQTKIVISGSQNLNSAIVKHRVIFSSDVSDNAQPKKKKIRRTNSTGVNFLGNSNSVNQGNHQQESSIFIIQPQDGEQKFTPTLEKNKSMSPDKSQKIRISQEFKFENPPERLQEQDEEGSSSQDSSYGNQQQIDRLIDQLQQIKKRTPREELSSIIEDGGTAGFTFNNQSTNDLLPLKGLEEDSILMGSRPDCAYDNSLNQQSVNEYVLRGISKSPLLTRPPSIIDTSNMSELHKLHQQRAQISTAIIGKGVNTQRYSSMKGANLYLEVYQQKVINLPQQNKKIIQKKIGSKNTTQQQFLPAAPQLAVINEKFQPKIVQRQQSLIVPTYLSKQQLGDFGDTSILRHPKSVKMSRKLRRKILSSLYNEEKNQFQSQASVDFENFITNSKQQQTVIFPSTNGIKDSDITPKSETLSPLKQTQMRTASLHQINPIISVGAQQVSEKLKLPQSQRHNINKIISRDNKWVKLVNQQEDKMVTLQQQSVHQMNQNDIQEWMKIYYSRQAPNTTTANLQAQSQQGVRRKKISEGSNKMMINSEGGSCADRKMASTGTQFFPQSSNQTARFARKPKLEKLQSHDEVHTENEEQTMQARFDRLMNANFASSFQEVEHRMEQLQKKIKYMNSNNPILEKHPGILHIKTDDKINNAQQYWMREYSKYQISKNNYHEPTKKVSFVENPIIIVENNQELYID